MLIVNLLIVNFAFLLCMLGVKRPVDIAAILSHDPKHLGAYTDN
jgi:hypothetical protein